MIAKRMATVVLVLTVWLAVQGEAAAQEMPALVGLAHVGLTPPEGDWAGEFRDNIIRGPQPAVIHYWTAPGYFGPVFLHSSHPGVITVPAGEVSDVTHVQVAEVSAPTTVTITASTPAPVQTQKSVQVQVFPTLRIVEAALHPQKTHYAPNESVELRVSLNYPEPQTAQWGPVSAFRVYRPRLAGGLDAYDYWGIGNDLGPVTGTNSDYIFGIVQHQQTYAYRFRTAAPSGAGPPPVPSPWIWRIRVMLGHPTSGPHPHGTWSHDTTSVWIDVEVREVQPVVGSVTVSPSSVTGGAGAEGAVYVTSMRPGTSVEVQLASSLGSVQVPPSVTVTAGPDGSGSSTFPIATGIVPLTRTVTLTGTAAGGSASGPLTVVGIALEPIRVNFTDLRAGELLEVRLVLDRAPPVDLPVALESSDPRLLGLPREVVFRAGERERTISVRLARDLDRATTVTLRARTAHEPQRSRDQVIRIRPRR